MVTSEQKELRINQIFEDLEDWLEDGPPDETVSDAQFLRDLTSRARDLVGAIEALTVEDVSEIWAEEEEEV